MADDRYEIVSTRGVRLDRYTLYNLQRAEKFFGSTLVLSQGSYNAGGVAQSAGTHDGGGALDVIVRGWSTARITRLVHALRKAGFAAWHRTPDQGNWPEHVHAILLGNAKASSGAKLQQLSYINGNDGLGDGSHRDPDQFRPALKAAPFAMRFQVALPKGARDLHVVVRSKPSSKSPSLKKDGKTVLLTQGDVFESPNEGNDWVETKRGGYVPRDHVKRVS